MYLLFAFEFILLVSLFIDCVISISDRCTYCKWSYKCSGDRWRRMPPGCSPSLLLVPDATLTLLNEWTLKAAGWKVKHGDRLALCLSAFVDLTWSTQCPQLRAAIQRAMEWTQWLLVSCQALLVAKLFHRQSGRTRSLVPLSSWVLVPPFFLTDRFCDLTGIWSHPEQRCDKQLHQIQKCFYYKIWSWSGTYICEIYLIHMILIHCVLRYANRVIY